MISMCPKCKNYEWDKEVIGADKKIVRCPHCNHEWRSKGLPLFVLTGCSGVGKTTTALELMQRETDFVILDADYFTILPSETMEDWVSHIEPQEELSADIMQGGKPVMWAMAGCLDKLSSTYNARFFNGIYCLALTCGTEELRRRMTEGRNITDEKWIQSSIEYNQFFLDHDIIGDISFSKFDTTNKSTDEIADYVIEWVGRNLHGADRETEGTDRSK